MTIFGNKRTLRQHLEHQAHTQPSAPALLAPGREAISYQQLFAVVQGVRPWLASSGLGSGSRIALLMPGGFDLAVAALCIGCQATAIPLNPLLTEPELLALLSEARADAVVGLPDAPVPARVARRLGLASLAFDLEQLLAGSSESPLERDVQWTEPEPGDTAFVLFTSGTTGRPKRVPLKHQQVLQSAWNIGRHLALTPQDRNLLVSSLHHSQGLILGLITPLAAGASVVCVPRFGMPDFLDWIVEFKPTWYTASPAIHQAVAAQPDAYRARCAGHTFRFIRSGASVLPKAIIEGLESLTGAPVIDTYGMTESATQMASSPLPPGLRKLGSVGQPAGAQLRVVDEHGKIQPAGSIGDIVARGPAMFDGYEDNPTANAEAFRDGWFVTGDRGWFDVEGYLYLAGRNNEIIDRGGEKIAPFEVERALLQLPGVVEAAAYPAPHPTLGEDVHAAVVLASGAAVESHGLRALLFGVIADFKIPACIHVLQSIPMGAGGKIQRRRLHDQIAAVALPVATAAPLLTQLQKRIAAVFTEILNQPVTGLDANFLALGGDSLSAARLVLATNQIWGVDLPVSALLAEPAVGDFTNVVQAAIDQADALSRALEHELDALSDDEVDRLLEAG